MQKLCVVILLAFAACACDRVQETLLPVNPAAIMAYHEADQALLKRARRGVRSTMTMVGPDGSSIEGFDEVISGTPNRLREVRPDYEAVGVGDVICTQAKGSSAPVCEEGEFEPGLTELGDSRILRATSTVARCGRATCRRVRIEQAHTPWAETVKLLKREKASMEEGRRVIILLITEDDLPYSLVEWESSDGKRVEGKATYLFDYDTSVPPIDLPSQANSVLSSMGE